ncbi:MAG: ketoacid-CoA transferase [Thermoprotei archaeon]|nr:MAG: ketoacid-CoA transferase [Thermoprotei archaeon]RLF14406.1 MAG: ketoacid-CoA transferase [Thermoprotei archaeon]
MSYTRREMMAIAAGRLIRDGDVVFAGTGLPLLAATVAKKIHAPRCVIFFETGAIDSALPELPLYVADSRVMYGASINAGLLEAFSILSSPKLRTIALLGAAQVDKYGNLNSTCIGDYHKPSRRLPGSGGACDGASLAWGFIVFIPHERRRFVEKLDYLTSPGWINGGNSRREAGLPRGGPIAVVTDLGILKFDEETREMYLAEYYPSVTPRQIQENTGFELDVSRAFEAQPPGERELKILREEVDPQGLIR